MADFEYTYSAPEQEEIRQIRSKYLPKEEDKMEKLRRLDESVTRRATVAALCAGILGCLIFGTGMSCCLVWKAYLPGILISIPGVAAMVAAFPLYRSIETKQRQRIAPEILRLTDELMR